jgi:chemotaxis protein MotB
MSRKFIALALVVAGSGCVTLKEHEAKVQELEARRAQSERDAAARRDAEAKAHAAKVAELQAALEALKRELDDRVLQLSQAVKSNDSLGQQSDAQTALIAELKKRLEKLGQNVDRLMNEKGQLAQGLEDSKARLEELRKQREAAEQRLATFRQLLDRFKSMIDSGQLKVLVRSGRMLISLPDNVLFDSGRTDIKAGGKTALTKVAEVLGGIADRNFIVAGHTDDVPIKTARFPSNWDLSTARAVEVVNFLVSHGMKPKALAAAGYAEFDPVAANDTPENKALNRRIEIVLQPNLSELPTLQPVSM